MNSLPPFADSREAALAHLAEYGFARLPNALAPDDVARARARVESQAKGEADLGHAHYDGWGPELVAKYYPDRLDELPPGPNQRIWNLINKGEIFRRIAVKPDTLSLVKALLADPNQSDDVLLSSFTANIARQGGAPMRLHSDQGYVPDETGYPVVANIMWMLTDFTEENGATRVVPGSHKRPSPRGLTERPDTMAATGPAGTALIFDGRIWHGTGANRTDEPRLGILSYYCRPFIRQQENFTMSVAPEVVEHCSEELLALLGFRTWNTLGMVEGTHHGQINRRPHEFVTEL